MESKTFPKPEDALAFVKSIQDKNYVTGVQNQDGSATVSWVPVKNYVAVDGKEYPDEAWITQKGEMFLIADLTEAHAKNILRMIIRRDREYEASVQAAASKIVESLSGTDESEWINDPEPYSDFTGLLDETPAPKGTLLN